MADQQSLPIPQGATIGAPVPAGATVGAPQQAKAIPVPEGATVGEPTEESTPPAPDRGIMANIVGGFLKGAGETATGIANATSEGVALASGKPNWRDYGGGRMEDSTTEQPSIARGIGEGAENVGEFFLGGEVLDALKGLEVFSGAAKAAKLAELAQKYPIVGRMLAMSKEYPVIAKILGETAKGATVGAAQGAVKGAATGQAAQGAKGGAIGGAIGGGTGEAVVAGAGKVLGTEAADALTRAVRPTGNIGRNFQEKATLALPRLVEANKTSPINNLEELTDVAHKEADSLWTNEIEPQIERQAGKFVDGRPIADAIRNGILPGDADLFGSSVVKATEDLAQKFDGTASGSHMMTVRQAADRLQSLNRQLNALYKLPPEARYAAGQNLSLEAMQNAADELRQQLFKKLELEGEADPAGLRKTYGALKDVQQAAEKRAIVYGRQNPINLTEILAAATGAGEATSAIMGGHPMEALAGAAPIIVARLAKTLNSPEYLIKSAVEDALNPSMLTKAGKAAGEALPVGTGATGAMAGQTMAERVTFRASDGSVHSVPADQVHAARQIDPNLTIMSYPAEAMEQAFK